MNKGFIILGNQLFNAKYYEPFQDNIFFLAEDYGLCTYQKHHKHKIIFFLSCMRSFKDELLNLKYNVYYKYCNDKSFKDKYEYKLENFVKEKKINHISFFEIEDKDFEVRIISLLKRLNIKFSCLTSPMFLSTRNEFKDFLSEGKKPLMAKFYKKQRIKNRILIDEKNKPYGGKWSYDSENRKKIPKNLELPKQPIFKKTNYTLSIINFVNSNFSGHAGSTDNFWIGTTRQDAWDCLENFISKKIELFGDYEDAVSSKDNILFHSALSPFLNVGLITPREIIDKLTKYEGKIRINSYEGFIRQIIGWREFIRGIYQNYNIHLQENNFFKHERHMKESWYNGTTGLLPLDFSIKNAIKYGWSHHIERLMILSNIMNLCEIKPIQVFEWFMEMFIDSSDWVMSPNVFGMGLFSDGGIFATKPYICGSSYFLKMMDFERGTWCNVMDGLYWRFINKNREFFLKNPRLSMMVRIFDKMNEERKKEIFLSAEKFLSKNLK